MWDKDLSLAQERECNVSNLKFVLKIGQVSNKSIYEIWDGEKHVGYITRGNMGWTVDVEASQTRKQNIRSYVYLKDCKQFAREIRA